MSLIDAIALFLRNRRLLIGLAGASFVVVVGLTLLSTRSYSATGSFVPQASENPAAGFAGIAAQFGVNIPTGEATQSPDLYANVLSSRALLTRIVDREYTISHRRRLFGGDEGPITGNLATIFEVEEPAERARERSIRALRSRMTVRVARETGMVFFSVRTLWPELSYELADAMLDELNRFNLEVRQTTASHEREFVTTRLEHATTDLRRAEDRLQAFLMQNRNFRNSPELTFQQERLQREVSVHLQVVTSLAEANEKARIEEVRNTPVITVVDPPVVPAIPDRRYTAFKGLAALVFGTLLGSMIVLVREFLRRSQVEQPAAFDTLVAVKREAVADLRRLVPGRARNRVGE